MIKPPVLRPVFGSCEGLVAGVSQEITELTLASLPLTPSPLTHSTDDVLAVGAASAAPASPTTLTMAIPAAAMS